MGAARFSLRLEPELKDWLEVEAKRQKRSAGFIATEAIQRMKETTEAKRQLICDAIAEAEKGVFVSSEAVTEWFVSLDTDKEIPFPNPDVFLKPNS